MGYTHYWTPTALSVEAMAKVAAAADAIIGVADPDIAGWDGTGKPELSGERIAFNGRGPDDDHETFAIDADCPEWRFCKTARKPYDVVVTAVLTYLAAEYGFDVSSDGDASDWEAGNKLATLALGKPFPNPLAVTSDA